MEERGCSEAGGMSELGDGIGHTRLPNAKMGRASMPQGITQGEQGQPEFRKEQPRYAPGTLKDSEQ
jgi:hypothetical protein